MLLSRLRLLVFPQGTECHLKEVTFIPNGACLIDLLVVREYSSIIIELSNKLMNTITPPTNLNHLAERLKVLAEPKRLLILNLLLEGVHCNCELGDFLEMTPSLISHHIKVLREAGLVEMEKDALDARWVYYSVNAAALQELNDMFGAFFTPARIKPRHPTCGPQGSFLRPDEIAVTA